jgi:hypothetical protein
MKKKLEIEIYKLFESQTSIQEFEQYLYANADQLESEIEYDFFNELICYNYKAKHAKQELFSLINNYIDWGNYENWRINNLLNSIIVKDEYYADNLIKSYDLRCDGYRFLEVLGMRYGLNLASGYDEYIGDWRKIPEAIKIEFLNDDYSNIILEARKVRNWINNGKIRLKKQSSDYRNKLIYEDNRSIEEVSNAEVEWIKYWDSEKGLEEKFEHVSRPKWWLTLKENN